MIESTIMMNTDTEASGFTILAHMPQSPKSKSSISEERDSWENNE